MGANGQARSEVGQGSGAYQFLVQPRKTTAIHTNFYEAGSYFSTLNSIVEFANPTVGQLRFCFSKGPGGQVLVFNCAVIARVGHNVQIGFE